MFQDDLKGVSPARERNATARRQSTGLLHFPTNGATQTDLQAKDLKQANYLPLGAD